MNPPFVLLWLCVMAALPSCLLWDAWRRRRRERRRMQDFYYRIRVGNRSAVLKERFSLEMLIRDLLGGRSKLQKEPVGLGEISITLEPAPPPPPDPEWREEKDAR